MSNLEVTFGFRGALSKFEPTTGSDIMFFYYEVEREAAEVVEGQEAAK